MAEKISDNISKIVREVNKLKTAASDASKETKDLNEKLRFDPTNAELAERRVEALKNELVAYHHQMTTATRLARQLREEEAARTRQLSTLTVGTKEYEELEKELKSVDDSLQKLDSAATKAEKKVGNLQAALRGINAKNVAENLNAHTKSLDKWSKRADEAAKVAQKLQVALIAIAGIFAKITKDAISQGTELYTLSKRYRTSAENIQYWNRALQMATGENDLFTKSLQVMSKGLSTIPVGRGVAYNNALRGIGVSFEKIRDLDPTAQFEAIINGLKNVSDESLRGSYAIQLFGDSGQTIASALNGVNGEFEQYLEKAKRFSVISDENTKTLAAMGFELETVKSEFSRAGAEIAINLYPTIMQLAGLLNNTLIPILVGLSKNTWILYVAITAILALKIVPAVAKWVLELMVAKTANDTFTVSALAAKAAAIGLVGILGMVAYSIGKTAMDANTAYDELKEKADEAYNDMNTDYTSSFNKMQNISSDRTVNYNITVRGEGDTAVSDETASKIAQLTSEQINRELGALIKEY